MSAKLFCETERRRLQVRESQELNGMDYLEVSEDHLRLRIFFLKTPPRNITNDNIRIDGGRRITGIIVTKIRFCHQQHDDRDDCMEVWVDRAGDFSTYRICLVEPCVDESGEQKTRLLSGFDPRYACLGFRFCLDANADLDCKQAVLCPPAPHVEPEINYLAKDYGSFRRVLLDRMAVLMPDWTERHEADIGIALLEVLAYTADRLSYFQDAVATEAYLNTARQRISVRRHTLLIDYRMHEGCNARVFVQVRTGENKLPLKFADFAFVTRLADPQLSSEPVLSWQQLQGVASYDVFLPVCLGHNNATFRKAQNEIRFYTWGDRDCCLPKSATCATLIDPQPAIVEVPPSAPSAHTTAAHEPYCPPEKPPLPPCQEPQRPESGLFLQPGDILIFVEAVGPHSGEPEDADPKRRHAVRLTKVWRSIDRLFNQPVVEIEWSPEDALPFALCLSTRTDAEHGCKPLPFVSVALGNIVLADHGQRDSEDLPLPVVDFTERGCSADFRPREPVKTILPFEPKLKTGPLTHCAPIAANASAAALLLQDPRVAAPSIQLRRGQAKAAWTPKPDLLHSGPTDLDFVVETDNDGIAHLRFGDGTLGKQPPVDANLTATYRIGNGIAGNVGAGIGPGDQGPGIAHIVFESKQSGLDVVVWNPLPAVGGIDPEALDDVKRCAPHAFRDKLMRAITADDYATLAAADVEIQRAEARLEWSGSWYEADVAIDPLARLSEMELSRLPARIESELEPFRRMGHDLRANPGETVPINVVLTICVQAGYLAGHVKAALLIRFRAFFQPDNLTFGQGIAVSELVALAKAEAGVEDVIVTKLERRFLPSVEALTTGILTMTAWEIARLDNDSNQPENGTLTLVMRGGR